jgi:hypothetical protein
MTSMEMKFLVLIIAFGLAINKFNGFVEGMSQIDIRFTIHLIELHSNENEMYFNLIFFNSDKLMR